ncbi:MAG: HAD family phosphatase [Methylacidiphilales bacterium]|nr:HAD family phosphatase [Candidatus Methylacidiphilales bacterium]
MSSKRGAVFDWDGVIINSAAHHEESWTRLARELDKPLPDGHFKRGFGMKNEVIFPNILHWTSDPVEIRIYSLRKEAIYREIVVEKGVKPLPGVESWLKNLRAENIPCVVASSTHLENITTTLEVLGFENYFAAIVSAEDVKKGKPDPEVFLTAAKKIGAEPAQSVVFEDALVGISAGKAAGMKVVAVATTEPKDKLAHADWVVDQLDELSIAQLWPE